MDYKDKWGRFAFPENTRRFSTVSEIAASFDKANLSAKKTKVSGPILAADGDKIVTNDSDEHWICVGETGSKKTRCFIRPLLYTLAKARESAIITDVKGELSSDPTIRGLMEENDVEGVFLDFRNFAGDGYDLFENAYEARMAGDKDKAALNIVRMTDAFVSAFGKGSGSNYDPFWDCMASMYMASAMQYILELCAVNGGLRKFFNLKTLARFIDLEGNEAFQGIIDILHANSDSTVIQGLRGIANTAERTKASISATVNSYLSNYVSQESLMNMLSHSTFNVPDLYRRPMFVFFVIPDETSAYDRIVGMIMNSVYAKLIEVFTASYTPSKPPACRVNWVCDEFCNVRIADVGAKISASRSRAMRFFLAFQSLGQLRASYGNTASVIIGNCKNLMFLQSSDPEMLRYVSDRGGITLISDHKGGEPLVSIDFLTRLKKERDYKEAVYIRDNTVFRAVLPDGDRYPCVEKYVGKKSVCFNRKFEEHTESISASDYIHGLISHKYIKPFGVLTPFQKKSIEAFSNKLSYEKLKRIGLSNAATNEKQESKKADNQ